MKKARKLVALVAAAVLTLGSVFTVLGDDMQYADLNYTQKSFTTNGNRYLGNIPEITGMDALNKKIYDDIYSQYKNVGDDYFSSYGSSMPAVSFEVLDLDRFAGIEIMLPFVGKDFSLVYYIDKETMTELTEDEFAAAIDGWLDENVAEEEAKEATKEETKEATKEETKEVTKEETKEATEKEEVEDSGDLVDDTSDWVLPLRDVAMQLGYGVQWDGIARTVTLTADGEFVTMLTIGLNAYGDDGSIRLESAPSIEDGLTYVPVSFFEQILGYEVTVYEDGTVEIE